MSNHVISVEHITKYYDLGVIGTGTLGRDLNRWWARLRHHPDPESRVGQDMVPRSQSGSILALNDVSFTVQSGRALGFIGRNGAGKSTILKILSRVTAPSSGRVKIKGRIGSLLEVGTGFHPELTGRENVYLNGAILGMKKNEIQKKFDEIVDFSGVERFIDTPVKRYSSGMYVRLAFAVAAHLDPEILIVDEVLAVGDAEFQKKCLGKMGDVTGGGRTVLFVSHNMTAVQALCERVILLNSGRIEREGNAEEVISSYLAEAYDPDTISNDLLAIKTREGSGKIKFVRWNVRDDLLGTGNTIRTGQGCTFEMEYTSDSSQPHHNVDLSITIDDKYGRAILTAATSFLNAGFKTIPPKGVFKCHFDSLPFLPDQYQVHLWCGVDGETSDKLNNAGRLNVVEADIYGTGRIPRPKHGMVIARDFTWDVS